MENTLHQWQMRQLEERFRAGEEWVGWQSAKERESYFIFTDTKVQNNMGHATAAFTLDVYGHVSEKLKDASADRMQQYIQNL